MDAEWRSASVQYRARSYFRASARFFPASTRSGNVEKSKLKKEHKKALRLSKVEALTLYTRLPTVFYRWQKVFFENGTAAFEPKARSNHSAEQERIDCLEKKIQTKDEVLAELMAEHVALKTTLGEL
jgi:hypothetical protein